MLRRPYGTSGIELSVIGFGGIVVMNESPETAARVVSEAVDCGVNYFDVAPSYGNAEECLGPALEPHRAGVFLACKTGQRTKAGASAELRASLRNLRTDYVDLYQLHAVTSPEDVATILGAGGALEAFVEAREAGLVRHLGFSAHSVQAAIAMLRAFHFDSVLFPLNWNTYGAGNFGPQVVEEARAQGASVLALKSMALTHWAEGEHHAYSKPWHRPEMGDDTLAALALRFTLSLPITAALPPGDVELFRLALSIIAPMGQIEPLSAAEVGVLRAAAAGNPPIFTNPPEVIG